MRDQMIRDGYVFTAREPFAFPVFAWTMNLEVSHETKLRASARTVLRLAREGLGTVGAIAQAMGFGSDGRLVATTATQLLALGAVAVAEGRIVVTPVGEGMLATARIVTRENVTATGYFRALEQRWSWHRPDSVEREVVKTIELPELPPRPSEQRHQIRDLIRKDGIPELNARAFAGAAPLLDLVGLEEMSAATVYERVGIEVWRHATSKKPTLHGYRDGEFDEALTKRLAGAIVKPKCGRVQLAPLLRKAQQATT